MQRISRIVSAALAVLLLCGWTLSSHTQWQSPVGGASGTSSAISTTGDQLIVFDVSWYNQLGGSPTVSDSLSNTWTLIHSQNNSGNTANNLYYCAQPCTVGGSQTFTVSGTQIYFSARITAWSGGATSSIFDVNGFNTSSAGATTMTPSAVTASQANSLYITSIASDVTVTNAAQINSPFTVSDAQGNAQGGQGTGGAQAYYIESGGPTSQNPTWSNMNPTGSGLAQANIATFKPGAAAPTVKPLLFHSIP
jgi:hypothetical protein